MIGGAVDRAGLIGYDLKVAVGNWLADTRLLGMWPRTPDRDLPMGGDEVKSKKKGGGRGG